MSQIDLTNKKIGQLTIICLLKKRGKNRERMWKCKCSCGKFINVSTSSLNRGNNKSCGCLFKHNLINKKFGKLLVIGLCLEKYHRFQVWKCKCECGMIKKLPTLSLTSGKTKSCGCLQKEIAKQLGQNNALPHGIMESNMLFKNYKKRAKDKKISFTINKKHFIDLISKNCYYCGIEPKQHHKNFRGFYYNGIDRINSSKGYTKRNCVTCCKVCNTAKGNMSIEQFKTWIKMINRNFIKC